MSHYTKIPAPMDDVLAKRWKKKYPFTAYGLGNYQRYHKGVWKSIERQLIKEEITKIVIDAKNEGIIPTAYRINSILEIATNLMFVENHLWNANPDILVCRNGTLVLPTRELQPNSPINYVTTGVPYDYDPQAHAPNLARVLSTLPKDVVEFLQEIAGYCLTTDTKFEIAIWLCGPPASGKSTFILALQTMLGGRSGVIGLATIDNSRFSLWDLPGKTLLVSTESPSKTITSTHLINAIISGEPILVERKYHDLTEITPRAKIIWAMNESPTISSIDDGIFRRIKIVSFSQIPSNEIDPMIREGIKGEGSGILNWALDGCQRLNSRGRFSIPSSVKSATDKYRNEMDVAGQFLLEECILDPQAKTKSSYLYASYQAWCLNNGHKPKNSTNIAGEWNRLGLISTRFSDGIYWNGVKLRNGMPF